MTLEEKRAFVRAYCRGRMCDNCAVGKIADEEYESGATKRTVCYEIATEEQLDARIAAIEKENMLASDFATAKTVAQIDDEIVKTKAEICQEDCDKHITCEDCPCKGLADSKHDSYCGFDELFSEEDLDEYIDHFNAAEETEKEFTAPATPDNVNRPKHYELPGGIECFDVILATQGREAAKAFCICNAIKYLFRHRNKNGVEDVKKAKWYIDKYLELEENK